MSSLSHEFVRNLEAAAQAALGNQKGITPEARQEAEEVLLSFKRSNPSFQDCRILLENSQLDTVQYHAASAFKDAVIREWSQTQENERNALQDFILNFVMGHKQVSAFVREILTQILAVMIKLTTVADKNPKNREGVYSFLTNLIKSGDMQQRTIACSIISSLVTEFSITTKSSDMKITLDQHWRCKKEFENYDIKVMFGLVLDVLKHMAQVDDLNSKEHVHLLSKFLVIAEQILSWTFTATSGYSRRSILVQTDSDKVIFKPHKDWEGVILNSETIHLFFVLNRKCQNFEDLSHVCVSCLAQLASLQGPIVDKMEKKCFYLKHFVQDFLQIYGSGKFNDFEALGIANVAKNLIDSNKIEVWAANPELQGIFHQFIVSLTELTCTSMSGAANEEMLDSDDHLYMESFEVFLDTWTTIIQSVENGKDFLTPSAMRIFENYIKCHILPPDGTRSILNDDHDIEELEDDDRDRFSGQLMSVAFLARLSPETSLLALSSLLENRILALKHHLYLIQSKAQINDSLMENLYEDLHWLILITGHVLADEYEGEMIPSEIVKFSITQKSKIDENLTLEILGSPEKCLEILSRNGQKVDVVVRCIAVIFSLCGLIKQATESNMVENLSPEVVQDLVWFLRTFSKPYLFFQEDYYDEISPILSSAFGPDSNGAKWCVDFVTKFSCTILQHWTSEPKLLEDTSDLLSVIVANNNRCATVASCGDFWKLAHSMCVGEQNFRNHPPIIKQQIMTSIVTVVTSNMNLYNDKYWEQTINLVKKRYHDITMKYIFVKNAQNAAAIDEFLTVLDLYRGVAEAASPSNCLQIFNFLSDLLSDGSKILHSCHGNQGVIVCTLELFTMVAHGQICYLKESKCQQLYEWSLHLLQAFSSITKNLHSRDAEEESFQDLSYVLELLTHLLNRDFIDFSDPDTEVNTGPGLNLNSKQVSVADVVLYGISIILPHLNQQLLTYPSLCCQYYKLVTFMCEIYPEKIELLPTEVFNSFMYSLRIGMTSYGNDNCKLCLEAILGLVEHACGIPTESVLKTALLPFIKMVFDVILVHAGDMELLRSAGEAFYSMFRFNTPRVLELFSVLVESQTESRNKQTLVTEFSKLSPNINTNLKFDRSDKTQFIKTLEEVIFAVRGILCVK